jgi:hypothetical protein
MSWPTANDYLEAIEHPLRRFCNADLKRSQPARDDQGAVRVATGKRLDVFEMRGANNHDRWAIGCFTQQPRHLGRRYHLINNHLADNPVAGLVGTEYYDQGICVKGRWYPITISRWVDGLRLADWVQSNAAQPHQMQNLADAWYRLTRDLRRANVAHGNLCSDTVLVAEPIPGKIELKLVDYDGLYVPFLDESPPEEMGHVDYQHPQRFARKLYHAEADRFSQLLVYTALVALAAGGQELWAKYDHSGSLLFRQRDLQEPVTSGLLRELWRSPQGQVRDFAGYLLLAAHDDVDQVPDLVPLVDAVRNAVGDGSSARSSLSAGQTQRIELLLGERPGGAKHTTNLDIFVDEDDGERERFALEVDDEPPPLPPPLTPPALARPTPPPMKMPPSPHARSFTLEAWMPEQIAVLKLEGFVRSAGGRIVQSVPGLITVHLLDEADLVRPPSPGLLGWLGLAEQPPPLPRVMGVLELEMEHKVSGTRQLLGITVRISPSPERGLPLRWNAFCERTFCDLRGHLIGNQSS